VNLFLLTGRKGSGDNWRVSAHAGSVCFFDFDCDSVRTCHLWCVQTREAYGVSANTIIIEKGGEREGRDGRNPTLKNMSALMSAVKAHY
jgi:hypothetical protein